MTYLKVGDGVWVNGEINPYNLGSWPCETRDPVKECAEARSRILKARTGEEMSFADRGHDWQSAMRGHQKMLDYADECERMFGVSVRPESATDLVNRVAGEQREGKR